VGTWRRLFFFAASLALVLAPPGIAGGVTYHGSLSWDTGLEATDGWAAEGTEIEWWVTDFTSYFHYRYKFTLGGQGALSHAIIETTEDLFTTGSLWGVFYDGESVPVCAPWVEVGEHKGCDPNELPNPNMPENVWGVKFAEFGEDNGVVEFYSSHVPVWKDVFCKDGKHGGEYATFWNKGFEIPDPTVGPLVEGSVDWHILAPDGTVPEPLTVLGLVLGMSSIGAYIRRRRMK